MSLNEVNDTSSQQNSRQASMTSSFDVNTHFSVGSASNTSRETSHSSSLEATNNPSSSGMGANGRYYNPVVMSFIRDDWIKQQLHLREAAYTRFQNTNVVTGTWNVNAKKPFTASEANKLVQWIQLQTTGITQQLRSPTSSTSNLPDIIALGFQEIVDLNAVNVVVNNMSAQRAGAWEESILYALNNHMSNQQYRVVMTKHLVGIMLIVFVRVDHAPYVKEIYGATAGVGVLGMMGNKGGAAIRMGFYDSSICFVCAHLAAHKENCAGRNADYANILNKIDFGDNDNDTNTGTGSNGSSGHNSSGLNRFESSDTVPILNHDYVFWIGDLNYRIDDLSTEECFQCVENGDITFLAKHDQLNLERAKGNCFHGFQEGLLTFPPTYKFQAGTSLYERRPEKKLRAPAWCDRVLWKAKHSSQVVQKTYGTCMALEISDHKPVQASFEIQVKHTIEEQKNQVMKEIMLQLDKWENENMPKVQLEVLDQRTTSNSSTGSTILYFPSLKYQVPQIKTLTIENIGVVVAHFRFIPKLDDVAICKKWLQISPLYGMIPPKEKIQIQITAKMDTQSAQEIAAGIETLDDTMILRIENGRDYFLMVSGNFENSSFGLSLDQLILMQEPVRKYTPSLTIAQLEQYAVADQTNTATSPRAGGNSTPASPRGTGVTSPTANASANATPGSPFAISFPRNAPTSPTGASTGSIPSIVSSPTPMAPQRVPKELWRMINDLYQHFIKEKSLFLEAGNKIEVMELREALDTGVPFPNHSGYSMAELLLSWLQSLRGSVVPDEILTEIENLPELPKDAAQAAQISMETLRNTYRVGCRTLLDGLSPVRYNTFIYIVSFLKEVLKHHASNKLTPQKLAYVFSRCLLSPISSSSTSSSRNNNNNNNNSSSNSNNDSQQQQETFLSENALIEETSRLNLASAQRTQSFILRAEKLERMLLFFFSTNTL